MIKESKRDSANNNPKITKIDEPKVLSSNSQEIKNITSEFSHLKINSELSKSPKNTTQIAYNEINNKTKLDLEDNLNNPNKIIENIGKENSNISSLDEKLNNYNKKLKTPLKLQSSPGNFQLKPNANFQMKSRKNTYTESDFNTAHFNQINIKSPIYSYFDQSQKFLSENYSGDGYMNFSENRIIKKSSEQEENISKKNRSDENPETPSIIPNKAEKSIEHDSESMNYNDLNLFTSPDAHNSSHVSGGINNIHTNKISRKSSQATISNKRGNSQNKFINSIGQTENENIDFNLDIPLNESNDDIIINNNNEIRLNKDIMNNNPMNENTNFLLNQLGNPWLNINNTNFDNINNDYINKNIQQKILNNNNLGNINNIIPINNFNNRNINNINNMKNLNQINNNNELINLLQNINSLNNINNINNNNEIKDIKKLLILKYLNSQNQNRISLPIQNNLKNIPLQYNFQNNYQNIQNNNNLPNLQNIRDIQTIQNLLNLKRIQDMKNQQTQNIQNLQNIHNLNNNLNKLNNLNNKPNINNLLLNQNPKDPNALLYEHLKNNLLSNPNYINNNNNNNNNSIHSQPNNNSLNMSNYQSSNQSNSKSISKTNSKSGEDSIVDDNVKNLNPEDYIYEKFGKRGWQCERCRNFNFEARTKCNRCGSPMRPKIIKKKAKLSDKDKQTKKKLIERSGDWHCPNCKNLNFAFRQKCNRCQLAKPEMNQNMKQINNEQIMMNKLKLLYNNNLLKNLQQNQIPQEQQGQNHGQSQINNINNMPTNNTLQLLNNNMNCAMNMGVNNCYNNINIYNLSPAQIEQLNQIIQSSQANQRILGQPNNNLNNYQLIQKLNQLNQIKQSSINQGLPKIINNNLNNPNSLQIQLNNLLNNKQNNNINNSINNLIIAKILSQYQNNLMNKSNQQNNNNQMHNNLNNDNIARKLNLIDNLNSSLQFNNNNPNNINNNLFRNLSNLNNNNSNNNFPFPINNNINNLFNKENSLFNNNPNNSQIKINTHSTNPSLNNLILNINNSNDKKSESDEEKNEFENEENEEDEEEEFGNNIKENY